VSFFKRLEEKLLNVRHFAIDKVYFIELMGPPITHLIGHFSRLTLTPPMVLVPFAMFLLSGVARDYLVDKRVHPLTATLAIAMFASFPLQGAVIGPSAAWHNFVIRLAR
jgi:hypothetical protein